ncbi:MAG: hypothetical protein HEP71_34495 [Roseivirga sp.]|nr:hypothetical protein [Roseivirga sp.]
MIRFFRKIRPGQPKSFYFLLFIPALWLCAGTAYGQNPGKPKVLIITTGGTIANQTNAPLIEGHELIQAVPELTTYGDIEVEEFVNIGSSKMTPEI